MANNMSDSLETALLDYIFRTANSTNYGSGALTFYVGLATATPTDSSFAEVTGGAYARQTIAFTTAASGSLYGPSASQTVSFPTATANWSTISGYGIFTHTSATTGTNYIAWGVLNPTVAVTTNDQVSFAPSAMTLSFE